MIPKETLEKIRKTIKRIEITTRKIVDETMGGQYHSVFKGQGMDFDTVREYVPGDDIRSIDWNVSARMSHPYTKKFKEERELTVILVVDASASMIFGTTRDFKHENAAEICALIAFSAIKNNDRVGLAIFTEGIEHHLPAKKGRQHTLRLVRDVLFFKPRKKGSNIKNALEFVARTQKKKSVVFIISDFMDDGFYKNMQLLKRKHDVVTIQLVDPAETVLQGVGLVRLQDPESGQIKVIDSSSRRWRFDFERKRTMKQENLEKFFKTNGIDHVVIRTSEPYDEELVKFFKKRASRKR